MTNLLGIHDPYPIDLHGDNPGWCVVTVDCRNEPMTHWQTVTENLHSNGVNVIVRLNWGYGEAGTIPTPDRYEEFATLCSMWAVQLSSVKRFIIGNEWNHPQERPQGQVITPGNYVACFNLCYRAIKRARPDAEVIFAGTAPYLPEFLLHFRQALEHVTCDGISIHAYTHGIYSDLIYSKAQMETLPGVFYHFRVYQNFIENIPEAKRRLPVYITEANQGGPWDAGTATSWIDDALHEIDSWNKAGDVPIYCVCLYRWQAYDQWGIENNSAVVDAVRYAYTLGYESPTGSVPVVTDTAPSSPVGDDFERALAFVRKWEGGFSTDRNDKGNWTGCEVGKGEFKGTKYGISACAYPHLDIANLSEEMADEIYYRDYWLKSGADNFNWPLSLAIFNIAVNAGVETAGRFDTSSFDGYMADVIEWYTKLGIFDQYGRAWMKRCADVLRQA